MSTMQTPTLSKKQIKLTFSGKKKKPEVIKNVLGKPFQNYWPLLHSKDNNEMLETLEKFLPRLLPPKPVVKYSQIKNIPQEERKNFRSSLMKNDPIDANNENKQIIFGVNDVSKLLEKQEVGSILISAHVKPRLLVQHILDQAVLYQVPVLVVSDLKTVCKARCGIGGIAMCILKSAPSESPLGLIHQTITNIFERYRVHKHHINSNRKLAATTISITDDSEDDSNNEVNIQESRTEFHLKKIRGKRAFVPGLSLKQDMSIIELGTDTSLEESDELALEYISMQVKRFKGDKDRKKRKVEKFKKN